MLDEKYWDKAAAFHGHKCPGLAIGFKAVEGALVELGISAENLPAIDEEIACVVENDACGVDAVQALMGCTYGKGNLIPRLRGKMAFTFFVRGGGPSVRLCLKADVWDHEDVVGSQAQQEFLISHPYTDLFDISQPSYGDPEMARHFNSQRCSMCGESTAEYFLRLQNRKPVCPDCLNAYEREGMD